MSGLPNGCWTCCEDIVWEYHPFAVDDNDDPLPIRLLGYTWKPCTCEVDT